MAMTYVFTKKFDGTFTMSWIGTELSTNLREVLRFSITPVKSIKSITNFYDTVRGETSQHFFKKYFSYSNLRSGVTMSEISPITGITGEYCPTNYLYLDLNYYRIDTNNVTDGVTLSVSNIVIEGTYDIEETDEIIEVPDDGYILNPKEIYKIFKLTGFELYGVNTNNLKIKYRFTQDGGRNYTAWEDLTTENISTKKLNPVRFAQVQYSIQKIDPSIVSKVYDVVLLGDFQNINNYYLKTNRYGVREDCPTGSSGTTITDGSTNGANSVCLSGRTSYKGDGDKTYNYNRDWFTQGLSCYLSGNIYTNLNAQNNTATANAGNYNPYNTEKIAGWYNFLAGGTNKILGWTVDYHLTDPDGKGIDSYLHEYQLFNIIDVQKIKIIVPENNFPDNQIQILDTWLDQMETFQVIILKDEFHKAFGIEKRPAQKDIIFFCQANRFFRVKHAQVKRDVMYMGIYYTVVLEKYEKLANEQNLSTASKSLIDPLTKNTTIDELFGFENRQEENKIASKQLKPTTHEYYRAAVNPSLQIVKKDIYNTIFGTNSKNNNATKIADNYYNLSSLPYGITAVTYSVGDYSLKVSDNRAITLWFNFNNKFDPSKIIDDDVYNSYFVKNNTYFEFLNNYDSINTKGYRVSYSNKKIVFTINNLEYTLDASGLTTNIWYAMLINMDNRQRKLSMDLYKRKLDYNITMFTSNYENATVNANNATGITYYSVRGYRPVKNTEITNQSIDPNLISLYNTEFTGITLNSFEIDKVITINSSDIKLTNIRIYDDVVSINSKNNILIQRVVQDADHLIIGDNANKKLYTSNIENTRWE
jgi:hypothetical protein